MKLTTVLAAFCSLLWSTTAIRAQVRPNYSGLWQQVNDRCVPKPKNSRAFYRLVIQQRDPILYLAITTGKGHLNLRYQIAGRELTYTGLDGDRFHTKVHWDGENLAFDTVEEERGHKVFAREVWTLLDFGHALRRVKDEDEPERHSHATYILEKQ